MREKVKGSRESAALIPGCRKVGAYLPCTRMPTREDVQCTESGVERTFWAKEACRMNFGKEFI